MSVAGGSKDDEVIIIGEATRAVFYFPLIYAGGHGNPIQDSDSGFVGVLLALCGGIPLWERVPEFGAE